MQIKQPLLTNTATYLGEWLCYLAKDESYLNKNIFVLIDSTGFYIDSTHIYNEKANAFCSSQIKQPLLTNKATYATYGSVI